MIRRASTLLVGCWLAATGCGGAGSAAGNRAAAPAGESAAPARPASGAAAQPVQDAAPAGKRVGPPEVRPVIVGGLRIEALPWGRERGLGQNGGYLAAYDTATGREVWTLKVYDVTYEPRMEQDVQDIFIQSLSLLPSGHELAVVDERDRHYVVDLRTRTVLAR